MDQQAQNHIALPDVPAIGDVIAEKYRVEGILGVGGMGVVLGARHLQLGQTVAIKVLSVSKEHQQDSIDRFLREGRAAAALSSDHVVRIYDVGQLPSGVPFMVMERLRGKDLSSVLTEFGPLPVGDAVEYAAQATVAIVEAHEVGIIHRDLKPSNLFLTLRSDGSPCVKVLDFGISKHLTDTEAKTLRGTLTSTRQVMGSPAYMSPEQVRDAKTVDHRTDIWALGVTLYELLTHHPAFDADTLPAICAAIAADPPVPVRQRRADIPEVVEAIVSKCLEKTPAKRFASARDLLTALRGWQGKSVERTISLRSDRPYGGVAEFDAAILRERKGSVGGLASSIGQQHVPATLSAERAAVEPPSLGEPSASSQHSQPDQGSTSDAKHGTLLSGRGPVARSIGSTPPSAPAAVAAPVEQQADSGIKLVETDAARRDSFNVTTGRILASVSKADPPSAPGVRNSRQYRGLALGLAGLVLLGATTVWYFARPNTTSTPTGAQSVEVGAPKGPTRFVLRIDSNPSEAQVLEAGRVLGVTPFSIELERTAVQGAPKQFVVRKDGFIEVRLQQEDSPIDVHQNVSLAKASAPVAEVATQGEQLPPRAAHGKTPVKNKAGKQPVPAANADASASVPEIRKSR